MPIIGCKVAGGSEQVERSGQVLEDIVASIHKVSRVVAEIATASQEQSSGIEQVNLAISQMDGVTQQNASLVEESAAASRSLEEQAQALKTRVTFFKLHAAEADDKARAPDAAAPAQTPVKGSAPHPTAYPAPSPAVKSLPV